MFLQNPAGQVTLEGYLVISWGMKRPIRLKIQDEKQMVAWSRSKSQEYSPDPVSPLGNKRLPELYGNSLNTHKYKSCDCLELSLINNKKAFVCLWVLCDLFRGMSRWGEFDNLNHIDEEETPQDESDTLSSSATG